MISGRKGQNYSGKHNRRPPLYDLHAPDIDCDNFSSGNSPTATHQDMSTGPDPSSSSQYNNADYRLPHMLSNRQTTASGYILLILFGHPMTQQVTKTSLMVRSPGPLDQEG